MRLLRLLLDLAGGGQTQLALVDGEPGVGKSRLMLELGVEAAGAGWRVLEGAAYEGQGLSPYQPFTEALRRYVDDVGRAAARRQLGAAAGRLLHLLPELRAPGAPPIPEDRPALFEAWAQFARGLARRRPLLVLLDDLHWADPACFELLLYLRRRLRDARLLVVAAYRGAELGADAVLQHILVELHRLRLATALHLARLDEPATAGLLAGLFGAPVAPRLAALVHRESEGNPFFVEEIARALAERGGVVPSGPGSELTEAAGGLPISVELREAIRDRLRRLSDEAQAVLRAAAVLGRSVALDDVAALCGAATQVVAAALMEATRRELMARRSSASYRFSHDKVRETLYAELDPLARSRLHARAAELIAGRAGPADAALVAYHYMRGPDPRQARPFLIAAGDQAVAAAAHANAAEYYGRAAELPGPVDPTQRAAIKIKLGDALSSAGRYDDALAALTSALDGVPDGAQLGEIHERIGRIHLAREESEPAERALRRALDLVGDEDRLHRARVLLPLGQLYVAVTGQLQDGSRVLHEALAASVQAGAAGLEAEVLTQLGQLEMHRGDFSSGRVRFEQALAVADRLDDPRLTALASNGLARLAYWTAAFHDLRTIAERELAVARRSGDPHRLGWPTFWLGQAALHLAAWDDAERYAGALVRLGEELGARRFLAQGHELRGIAAASRGERATACAELAEAVAQFRAIGPGTLIYYVGPYCLALIDAEQRELAGLAVDELLELARSFAPGTSPRVQALNVGALALLKLGRYGEAAELYDELLPAERQLHWHLVARTLGRIAMAEARWNRAAGHLTLARELATRGGGRVELVHVLSAQAEVAEHRGHVREATELARQSQRLALVCGMGAASARTGVPGRAPDGLSPREVEVLRLVAQGLTNRAIANALGIAEKTATNHLTHIFNKIGVDNRAGATAYALRHGLVA